VAVCAWVVNNLPCICCKDKLLSCCCVEQSSITPSSHVMHSPAKLHHTELTCHAQPCKAPSHRAHMSCTALHICWPAVQITLQATHGCMMLPTAILIATCTDIVLGGTSCTITAQHHEFMQLLCCTPSLQTHPAKLSCKATILQSYPAKLSCKATILQS
jgi:hypothetical protein